MAGLRKSKKNSEDQEKNKDIPKLSVDHFREISQLYRLYGCRTWKLLVYWKAAKFDDSGHMSAVLDWSNADEHELKVYEEFQPLSGIRYIGAGYLTYTPYTWATEWLRQWEWWLTNKATSEEKRGILSNKTWQRPQPQSSSPSPETMKIQTATHSDTSEPSITPGGMTLSDT